MPDGDGRNVEERMKDQKDEPRVSARRDFLKLSALGAAAAGAAMAARPETAEADEPAGAGYRETAHVRTYYETARF